MVYNEVIDVLSLAFLRRKLQALQEGGVCVQPTSWPVTYRHGGLVQEL